MSPEQSLSARSIINPAGPDGLIVVRNEAKLFQEMDHRGVIEAHSGMDGLFKPPPHAEFCVFNQRFRDAGASVRRRSNEKRYFIALHDRSAGEFPLAFEDPDPAGPASFAHPLAIGVVSEAVRERNVMLGGKEQGMDSLGVLHFGASDHCEMSNMRSVLPMTGDEGLFSGPFAYSDGAGAHAPGLPARFPKIERQAVRPAAS
jgi:hypothetical protein